jgi:hypothetical protein
MAKAPRAGAGVVHDVTATSVEAGPMTRKGGTAGPALHNGPASKASRPMPSGAAIVAPKGKPMKPLKG